ncbi:tRNA uridine-5-carboxymethylaminomethyl(34) synthesis GTPase MnmE [Lentiprolixibacter aurantiacus]|uniref:tRNA modification GTPase MnmE n=1 Tax=Lentiprolixibacter aurantiacus TaxID=2993939 RepID=A0AAE3MLV8_9FLAO|nr:tRNA uridine-5-carboxymethylaminomethyl(34) synthesis GTPase MnmE [Lentiprolixibacter aurantiacus]MCX2719818.1 tRNA uridine-5-carboxymethylaminomethyl(34) synthesis GTPase MnmE [Lentiprolixibacter aurantiacus]
MISEDTIIASATAPGIGAIAVLRISGVKAISLTDQVFSKDLPTAKTHTIHLGEIKDGDRILDQVLVSLFRGPHSYTGENVVEISCHGSPYIQEQVIQLFLRKGCRMANPGEFTLRAFLNGKLDLSQAEAVADIIASDSEASHKIAMQQMRGGFSSEIQLLRTELLNFASLIELELDFSEEDVEFADREAFLELLNRIEKTLKKLIDSFSLGNVIKNGIPIAIVGKPNVGKSTLLNALLNEERAIVSEIAGTTRDTIEDEITIGGIRFRFIDTAGIRDTGDQIEQIGIKRTFENIEKARVVFFLFEAKELQTHPEELHATIDKVRQKAREQPVLLLANKADAMETEVYKEQLHQLGNSTGMDFLALSALEHTGLDQLKDKLLHLVNTGTLQKNETIVTNSRHYDALLKALAEIQKVQESMEEGISGDLLAIDIRQALYHLGEITGEITTDDLLGNIFANFCIGK